MDRKNLMKGNSLKFKTLFVESEVARLKMEK